MNFVLIQFFANTAVAITLVVAHIIWLQSQAEYRLQKESTKYSGVSTGKDIKVKGFKIMDSTNTRQSAVSHKGLQQRRSFPNMMDHDGVEDAEVVEGVAAQSVEMQRSSSGHTSLRSWNSNSSTTTETSLSNEPSEEDAIPGQPANFGVVVPGVYRSSYPQEADYAFIQKLKLKTIVTLVDKEFPETFLPFMQANGIQHRHITMAGTKKEAIPVETMASILEVVHDKRNHPLLIHCNQGRHRTGCVVALIRKMQNWDLERILDEYKIFASPKPRDCDVEYVTKFQVADIKHLSLAPLAETIPAQHPVGSRRIRFLVVSFFFIFICWNTFRVFRQLGKQGPQHGALSSL